MKRPYVVTGKFHAGKKLKALLQAERCTPEHAELHAYRQKVLGESMIGDKDKASKWDLIATFAMVVLIGVGSLRGWW